MRASLIFCLFLCVVGGVDGSFDDLWEALDLLTGPILGGAQEPELGMTVPQIIQFRGYTIQSYNVTTEDGYILGMQRIPNGKVGSPLIAKRPPVLLQHGLICDSSIWVWNTPDKNLAYRLSDAGYDVWLGNFRGNKYSQTHMNLSAASKEFWDFSWDQMAAYDLPAMIDKILSETNQQQIMYVGHSMGTTTLFALLSTRAEYNNKVKIFAALAPPLNVTHMKSPLRLLGADDGAAFKLMDTFSIGKFDINNGLGNVLLTGACGIPLVSFVACTTLLFALGGPDYAQLNQSRLNYFMNLYPTIGSVQTIQHFLQEVDDKQYQKFDHGPDGNLAIYGQSTPPRYNITKITTPTALFWAKNDWLAPPEDAAQIPALLPSMVLNHKVANPDFTHMDFIIALDVNPLVYDHVLNLLKNYTSSTST